jgi:2-polyprenyl-3-methyl-5-hydroxy-6-metoxy-1,4-benzoquinol methylase
LLFQSDLINKDSLEWSIGNDLQKLPGFDLITVSLTLHHVVDTVLAAEVFNSHLDPGGTIAVADLDADNGECPPEKSKI